MDIDPDEQDWESVIWFLLANNLHISNSHEKRVKELKSTIETMDAELAALMESYVRLYKQKRAIRVASADYAKDPKWIVAGKELDRIIEAFKQRVKALG